MSTDQAVSTIGGALGGITLSLSLSSILKVLFTIVLCMIAVKVIGSMVARILSRSHMEKTLSGFINSMMKILLYFIAILIVLSTMGVDVTSLIALLSVAGLAVSLALQNTLANLAGGIQLLVTKPFAAGDYVDAGANSGTVNQIGLAYTVLTTPDNKVVHIPNSDIASGRIVNYSTKETRRVDIKVTASYDSSIESVKGAVMGLVEGNAAILKDPAPFVRISNYGASSIEYTIRVWCEGKDYWDVYFDLMDNMKPAFDKAGVEMTYDHLNVHVLNK